MAEALWGLNEMEGGWRIKCNDAGLKLVQAKVQSTLTAWLGAGGAGAELPYWKDIETEEPNYSTLMYAQGECFGLNTGCS
ncbi:hypothetical protein AMTR_s00007p00128440 [Amborella trichopoda]|uniref:Uncharacterized protein n=1 Tax=Amborella trichopoda TaxID=13333 RepID=W1PDZ0_AMBTC|nr:hypothetical protein AMTR_s00007p00128440 [Amborella trichopoda]